MEKLSQPPTASGGSSLNSYQTSNLKHKIEYEVAKSHYSMIKLGGIANILSGIVVICILHNHVTPVTLLYWYIALFTCNVINILWSLHFENDFLNPERLIIWRRGFYLIFAALCFIWGSIGIFFLAGDTHYQLYVIAFLLAVVIGFSFASITDATLASIALGFLLIPTISYHAYLGIHNLMVFGIDPDVNIGISISLLILGIFLLITCIIGSRLVNKYLRLSFENTALNEKLESLNKFLEQRVHERTIELEDSLKLVTYQASHDLLTNLPNQRLLLEYLNTAILNSNNNNHRFCVVFFSLNEIEKINDGLGYQIGDILIRTVAERLKNRFEPKNLIENNYRITLSRKDVFIILIDNIHKINEIKEKASALLTVLDTPIMTEKQPLKLTASIGISLYPRHGKEIKTLLMNADSAMLRAKQQGGNNLKIYKADIDAKISRQLEIEANLHFALDKNEFVLHYQPIINLKTGKICSAEALLRWNSLALGSIPPTDFIPLAEANGIIFPLGNWVARTACIQNKIWHDMGFTSFRMAINISAKQLANKAILQIFEDILTETKLNPEFIELELTEGVAFQDNAVPLLKRFKSMGFQLSIDDFGTGYSGLSTLKLFNIDTLKIDKIFVDDVEKNNDNSTIVSNTIALAQEMDLSVIAEGVETIEQVNFLKAHGCDMIQGYYFSKPVDAETFTKLLTSGTLFGG